MPLYAQTSWSLVAEPPCRVEETSAQLLPLKWNTPSLPLAPPNAQTSSGPSTDNLVTSPGKDVTTAQLLPFQRSTCDPPAVDWKAAHTLDGEEAAAAFT